jgi:two-component system, cell cycle response regulator
MSGYEVVAVYKADPLLARVPVLAVTALAMAGDREKVLAAGFDGYISKPIEPESFVAELEAFLPAAGATEPPGVGEGAPKPTGCDRLAPSAYPAVLLVDDDPFMLAVLADMLGDEPVRVLCAASGQEALALLEREPAEVILCDQAMPGMRGTEVLARVAARHPQTVRLMLTGQQDLAEIDDALQSGLAEAHYPKPVSGASLREHIRQAVTLQRTRVAV